MRRNFPAIHSNSVVGLLPKKKRSTQDCDEKRRKVPGMPKSAWHAPRCAEMGRRCEKGSGLSVAGLVPNEIPETRFLICEKEKKNAAAVICPRRSRESKMGPGQRHFQNMAKNSAMLRITINPMTRVSVISKESPFLGCLGHAEKSG